MRRSRILPAVFLCVCLILSYSGFILALGDETNLTQDTGPDETIPSLESPGENSVESDPGGMNEADNTGLDDGDEGSMDQGGESGSDIGYTGGDSGSSSDIDSGENGSEGFSPEEDAGDTNGSQENFDNNGEMTIDVEYLEDIPSGEEDQNLTGGYSHVDLLENTSTESGSGMNDQTNQTEEMDDQSNPDSADTPGAAINNSTGTSDGAEPVDISNGTTSLPDIIVNGGETVEVLDERTGSGIVSLGEIVISASGIALNASHCSSDYCFTGDYSNGNITILAAGDYYLTDNLDTDGESFTIQISSSGVTLDGNGKAVSGWMSGSGIEIDRGAHNVTISNFGTISGFDTGIESWADDTSIQNNIVSDNFRGIYAAGNNAVIEGNNAHDNYIQGMQISGDNILVRNNSIKENGAIGIESQGRYARISENILKDNSDTGIYSGGRNSTIADNTIETGSNAGIESDGDNAIIRNNSVKGYSDGINSEGDATTINGNNLTRNYRGLYVAGSGSHITDNRIVKNQYGIAFSDNTEATITGNKIINNSVGLRLIADDGQGSGLISDNYLGNAVNVGGLGNASIYSWNQVSPTRGTNIAGGPFLAGNYWSNTEGTGWSDTRNKTVTGYSTNPYEISAGVYDYTPLVKVDNSTPAPTPPPGGGTGGGFWSQDYDNDVYNESSSDDYSHPEDTNRSSLLPVNIIITGAVFRPGDLSHGRMLELTLQNIGTVQLPSEARIILSPENRLALEVGTLTPEYRGKEYGIIVPLEIPSEPGEYRYTYQPEQVTTDPDTGEEVRYSAGYLNTFMVTVSEDGSAGVAIV